MRRIGAPAAAAAAMLVAVLVLASPPAMAQPAGSVAIESVSVVPAQPMEGENATVFVEIFNNASVQIVLRNVTVTVSGVSAQPQVVGTLESLTVEPRSNRTVEFQWVALPGTATFSARAAVEQGGASFPLTPAVTVVSIEKPQVQEPGAVAAQIGVVLAVVLSIACVPAVLENLRGARRGR